MQPDERINTEDLGVLIMNNKRFAVNTRRGQPFNAVIEDFGGALRCWASRIPLTDEAAAFVRKNATFQPEQNNFVWNRDIRLEKVRKVTSA